MVTQWEYTRISASTMSQDTLIAELNRLGAEGWEAFALTSADKTIGLNSMTAIARREVVPPPPLSGSPADWYPDPCGRWQIRYWDGARWTAHVANRDTKAKGIDSPQVLAAAGDEQAD